MNKIFLTTAFLISSKLIAAPIDPSTADIKRSAYRIEESKFSHSFCAKAADEDAYRPTGNESKTPLYLIEKLLAHVNFTECLERSLESGEQISTKEKLQKFCDNEGEYNVRETIKKLESFKPFPSERYTKEFIADLVHTMKLVLKKRPTSCEKYLLRNLNSKSIANDIGEPLKNNEPIAVDESPAHKIKKIENNPFINNKISPSNSIKK